MVYEPAMTSNDPEQLRQVFRRRDGRYKHETVRGNNPEALQGRIDAHLAEGWELSKTSARGAVMQKAKGEAKQLEDDVWCMMYRLGFKEMSLDDQFRFNVDQNAKDRQFDVFAQDDDTAFVIECTTRQSGAKNDRVDLLTLLQKIEALRPAISRGLQSAPTDGGRPRKVKFAVAVRGAPSDANRQVRGRPRHRDHRRRGHSVLQRPFNPSQQSPPASSFLRHICGIRASPEWRPR